MIQIERFFENIFTQKEITTLRLRLFAIDHLSKVAAQNPGGIYNGIIAATEPLINTLFADLSETDTDSNSRKGNVITKKKARAAFINYLAQKEGIIKAAYGRKSAEYIEFFPSGINVFRHATDSVFLSMSDVVTKIAIKYQADLGTDLGDQLSARYTAYSAAYTNLLDKEGEVIGDKSEVRDAKTTLQLQLMVNICTIAIHNMGKPEAAKHYFVHHLLFPAKRHHLFKAKVESGMTKQVCTFKYSEGKRFHIMNTGGVPLHFQMSLNGNGVGRAVDVKPAEKLNEPFSFFSSAGDALQVTNQTDKRGSYMVWEIT